MNKINVQYGCGLSAPFSWINFDASPTLRLQKTPLLGAMLKNKLNVTFPDNVKYGDIIKGLPIREKSCDNVYCSHTLEHLSFEDCKIALKNTYTILKVGGLFRCIVPDMKIYIENYAGNLAAKNEDAGNIFIRQMMMGQEQRKRGLNNLLTFYFGNAHHLWMWDELSLKAALTDAGFSSIRRCEFNDSKESVFKDVENPGRFVESIAFECIK